MTGRDGRWRGVPPFILPIRTGVMATISTVAGQDDIFIIQVAGAKVGDMVKVLDMDGAAHNMQLVLPVGSAFSFRWLEPSESNTDGKFTKEGDQWYVDVDPGHNTGDKVKIKTQKGTQEVILGERVSDTRFIPMKNNYFVKNPVGGDPKWCVRVHDTTAKPGDTVKVAKKGGEPQSHVLIAEVQGHPGVWTSKNA